MAINRGHDHPERAYRGLQDPKLSATPGLLKILYGAGAPIVEALSRETDDGGAVRREQHMEEWQPKNLDIAFAAIGLGQEAVARRTGLR